MATAQTDGEPPRCGRTSLANSGCTENNSEAETSNVPANAIRPSLPDAWAASCRLSKSVPVLVVKLILCATGLPRTNMQCESFTVTEKLVRRRNYKWLWLTTIEFLPAAIPIWNISSRSKVAAEQGNASAQNNLGVMYGKGQGVPQDYVQAHMWLNLAAAQNEAFQAARNWFAKLMPPAQIAKAQRLAREWKPKN
jgi:TPR repeat protein